MALQNNGPKAFCDAFLPSSEPGGYLSPTDIQRIIPNLTVRKASPQVSICMKMVGTGVSVAKKNSKKTFEKTCVCRTAKADSMGIETHGKRSHMLATNIPIDGALGEMNFSQPAIRR
jgi:hypothetical protein